MAFNPEGNLFAILDLRIRQVLHRLFGNAP